MKKSILNDKGYNLLAIIDLNKINNWSEVKSQSVWTSVALKDHKEINNNNHLCFSFATRTFNDLTSFSTFLQDDRNKKIKFKSGEKKLAFLTFK